MKNDRKRTFLLITIPILALFVCFNTIPLIRGVVYSFTNFRGFGKYDWVGFRNYIDLFSRMQIEELVLQYRPTLLFVEHDRVFRENIATGGVEL